MHARYRMPRTLALAVAAVAAVACSDSGTEPDGLEPSAMIVGRTLHQVDRVGLPLLNTAFVASPTHKNAFNLGRPSTDLADFLDIITAVIVDRYGLNGTQADGLARVLLPDALPLLSLGGFPDGRRPEDDVVDFVLGLIHGVYGPPSAPRESDNVDANDKPFLTTFPYLAAPHGS